MLLDMFLIGRNKFLNSLEILSTPQNFWADKDSTNTLTPLSPNVTKCKYKLKQTTIIIEKMLQLKNVHSLKNGLKFENTKREHFIAKQHLLSFMKCQPFLVQRSIRSFQNK